MEGLPHLLADTDSHFRGEVQSLLKGTLDRLRGSTFLMTRKNGQNDQVNATDARFEFHKQFVIWLHGFLTAELHPTASYQRHISAVQGLQTLLKSGVDLSVSQIILSRLAKNSSQWPFHITIVDDLVRRMLCDLLLDPFDDVRSGALNILKIDNYTQHLRYEENDDCISPAKLTTFRTVPSVYSGTSEDIVLDRAKAIMLRTGRVDHADGVARLYDLRSNYWLQDNCETKQTESSSLQSQVAIVNDLTTLLESSLEVAKANMVDAVTKFPIHGLFTALR